MYNLQVGLPNLQGAAVIANLQVGSCKLLSGEVRLYCNRCTISKNNNYQSNDAITADKRF